MKWLNLCGKKEHGGLEIKDIKKFNKALIGKGKWRVMKEKNRLWKKIIK